MRRFFSWLKSLIRGHRDKRVARLGGYAGEEPVVPPRAFGPELGEAERLEQVRAHVSELGAESVDEATGHPLDNFINVKGHDWRRRLNAQFWTFLPSAWSRLGHAEAVVRHYELLHEHDLAKLRHSEAAVEAAMLALSGPEPLVDYRPAYRVGPPPNRAEGKRSARRGRVADRAMMASPASGQAGRAVRAAFAPSKLGRSELRWLVDPRDGDRVPRWTDPGFRDATLMAGRPRSAYLHVLALILAAGADIGAFDRIVQLVLPVSDLMVLIVVCGLTAVVLYIAHMIGVMLREAKAAPRGAAGALGRAGTWVARRLVAGGCAVIWLAIGLMAFWVRMTVTPAGTAQLGGGAGAAGAGVGSGAVTGSGASGSGTPGYLLQSAAIFLALYVATGIAAALGAYFTHNPHRGSYAATIRAHRKTTERAAASAYQLARAQAVVLHRHAEVETAQYLLDEAKERNWALTEEHKQAARIALAGMHKDPSVTDAYFEQDQEPYWRGRNGSRPENEQSGDDSHDESTA